MHEKGKTSATSQKHNKRMHENGALQLREEAEE